MVSVIVPVYNIEMYIQKCMDSVLKQDYKKIELIIIDDGSSDRTGEICKKYAELDERVLYLKKENEFPIFQKVRELFQPPYFRNTSSLLAI